MKESYLPTLLQMRLLVGFLGERAQYHGVLEAARRLHDEHLNVGKDSAEAAV